MRMSPVIVAVDEGPFVLLSGMAALTVTSPLVADRSGATRRQVWAAATAEPASIAPKPYLWLTWNPPPFVCHPPPPMSFWRAVLARMCLTSRHVRFGLASSISAITPETSGVADDVPPKLLV